MFSPMVSAPLTFTSGASIPTFTTNSWFKDLNFSTTTFDIGGAPTINVAGNLTLSASGGAPITLIYTATFKVPNTSLDGSKTEISNFDVTWPISKDGWNIQIVGLGYEQYIERLSGIGDEIDDYKSNLVVRFFYNSTPIVIFFILIFAFKSF